MSSAYGSNGGSSLVEQPGSGGGGGGGGTSTYLSGNGYSNDEILSLLPSFSYSLPVQVLVTGINLSICFVILSHLLFTAAYHYPLSKHNFILQFGGAIFLIVNLSTELAIIFAHAQRQSRRYPFGFNYVAVQVPPNEDSWNFAQQFFYLGLRAITVLFVHLTHIQFLTLLFPSRLERRLILWMLGPLALIASGMQFGDFTSTDAQKTSDLLDTLQRISESTLTMLYTCALFIWGLAVNRGRAWRTDGGTAAFGTAACFLAVANTSMAFLELRFDYLHWLPDLTWVVTAAQSWLGYWWWVGAGMGIGEVEDRAARAMRKRKRAIRRQRREQSKQQAAAAAAAAAAAREKGSSSGAVSVSGGDSAFGSLRRRLGLGTGSQSGSASGAVHGVGTANSANGSVAGSASQSRTAGTATARHGRAAHRSSANGDAAGGHGEGGAADDRGDIELQEVIVDSSGRVARDSRPSPGGRAGATANGHGPSAHFDGPAMSVSGMTTGSGSSNPSSTPNNFFTRGLRTLAEIQPAFLRARIDRLRREHAVAARRNAREQMDVVERIMGRNPQAGLYRAESRRAPALVAASPSQAPPQQQQQQHQHHQRTSSATVAPMPLLRPSAPTSPTTTSTGAPQRGSGRIPSSTPPDPGKTTTTNATRRRRGGGGGDEADADADVAGVRPAGDQAGWVDIEEEGDEDAAPSGAALGTGTSSSSPPTRAGDAPSARRRRSPAGDGGGGSDVADGTEAGGATGSSPAYGGAVAGGSERARAWVSNAVRRMRLKEQDTFDP